MKEEDYINKKEETISIQPRLYSFDNSWEIEVQKIRKSGNLKSTIVIDQVIRNGNIFYISLVSGQLLRWYPDEVVTDLILFESPIGFGIGVSGAIGNLDSKSKNRESSRTPQIFVDQTGNHSIITQTGRGETWYLHSSQTKAKFIQKLCSYSIQSVAWNINESSRNSAVSAIIGCKNGIILTTILGPEISSSSIVLRILYEIPGTPILSLLLDSTRISNLENIYSNNNCDNSNKVFYDENNEFETNNNDATRYQYVLTVSTPNKLLLWYGQNRIMDLFLKTDEAALDSSICSSKSCIEIDNLGEEYGSSIYSKIRLIDISGHYFLIWITSKIIKIYSINRKKKLIGNNIDNYIGNVKAYDFKSNNLKLPNSVECSRYHIIALYDDFVDIISLITAKSIAKLPINNALITGKYVDEIILNNSIIDLDVADFKSSSYGSRKSDDISSVGNINTSSLIRSLAVEFSSNYNNLSSLGESNYSEEGVELLDKVSFIWGYSNENLYKINIINEGETLWREWLYIGMYEESLASSDKIISKSLRLKKRNLIEKLHFIDLMIKGEIEEAAKLLSVIDEDLSFNEICNIFIHYSCWEGLILYLTSKINQLNCNFSNEYDTDSKVEDDNNVILKLSVLGLWLIELNSYISFILNEENISDKYYSNLIVILEKVHKIDEIEAIIYKILVEYNRRIGISYYSELRKEWQVLIQEYIFYSLIDSNLVNKCFELFVSINSNILKRDTLLVKYSPILGLLDSKRFISLIKRPSFSSVNINYILPYLIELKQLNSSKLDSTELNRLSILLIEYYISLSNKCTNEHKLERVSTRVKLLIHTETWKGTKTIWNVLAILCSKLDNGEEFLLSYITPLLGKARKDSYVDELELENVKKTANKNINNISLLEYNIDFDIPFLLSICKQNRYKKLTAYVYCLLGMYDSAMGICIKDLNNTKLAKDIIYNFIEDYHLRRKWILNLIKPLAYNKDIQGLTRLLNASPRYILTLSDILSIIPDDVQLSLLSDIIKNNINQFDDILLKRTKSYANYKLSSDNLANDLFLSHKCYNIIDPKTDLCLICYRSLFNFKGFTVEDIKEFILTLRIGSSDQFKLDIILNSFFTILNKNEEYQRYLFLNGDLNTNILVFPCSHYFHFGCFLFKYSVIMNNDEIAKLNRIISGICKYSQLHLNHSENNSNGNRHKKFPINGSKLSEKNVLTSLYNQLINFINSDCLICGELMIRNINKSFLSDNINDFSDI
ncbi:hypothetical protein RS030_170 [Cryptosporidium xiaoi]|uniref:Pep3/Vps18 beta-propeller domain-containing protein n=1 Tax=Cryptosporidium xiaoi TaxID=659607 RepID=A0AAV9Y016_9CRYT